MALVLAKNSGINLSKSAGALKKYVFGLSWDANTDLDASAIIVGRDGKAVKPEENNVSYYGNAPGNKNGIPANPVPGLAHSGDARDGAAAGDDETITIDTTALQGDRVVIAVTSYSEADPVVFAASSAPMAKLYDDKGNVLVEVKLDENAAFSTAMLFVEIFKDTNGDWNMKNLTETVGSSPNGLADVMAHFG